MKYFIVLIASLLTTSAYADRCFQLVEGKIGFLKSEKVSSHLSSFKGMLIKDNSSLLESLLVVKLSDISYTGPQDPMVKLVPYNASLTLVCVHKTSEAQDAAFVEYHREFTDKLKEKLLEEFQKIRNKSKEITDPKLAGLVNDIFTVDSSSPTFKDIEENAIKCRPRIEEYIGNPTPASVMDLVQKLYSFIPSVLTIGQIGATVLHPSNTNYVLSKNYRVAGKMTDAKTFNTKKYFLSLEDFLDFLTEDKSLAQLKKSAQHNQSEKSAYSSYLREVQGAPQESVELGLSLEEVPVSAQLIKQSIIRKGGEARFGISKEYYELLKTK
ncbi:MAG: hypothetical protein HON90_02760 [Halobacteriovoraceae bacterium]|nr:hypothetical protein [Halobacteriovoraceae bacterium]